MPQRTLQPTEAGLSLIAEFDVLLSEIQVNAMAVAKVRVRRDEPEIELHKREAYARVFILKVAYAIVHSCELGPTAPWQEVVRWLRKEAEGRMTDATGQGATD